MLLLLTITVAFAGYPPEQQHYWRAVMPIMRTYCNDSCHNADDKKGGLNLSRYDFIRTIQRDGEVFYRVIDQIESGAMPPAGKPQMSNTEQDTFIFYIKKYLNEALEVPDPGIIPPRRLSNREYRYAIQDLTNIVVNTDSIFPKDPAGGEGFDNFAKSLYITPLLMERYFEVASYVVNEWEKQEKDWSERNPKLRFSFGEKIRIQWYKWLKDKDIRLELATEYAKESLFPFASLAYRRYLNPNEKQDLLNFFQTVYLTQADASTAYYQSLKEVYKLILVSQNFLLRTEADPEKDRPYLVSNFELATRLSFFLWSSLPDYELLEVAYHQDLHNPKILQAQIQRMLQHPKAKRMAESFATQWLDVNQLQGSIEVDEEIFPEFDEELRAALYQESVEYFYHTLSKSRNFLELLNGKYTFLNEKLAQHYGIEGVEGSEMRQVDVANTSRGGILGMGGVQVVTSLPNRTSPVLRGKWVLEKILATPAKAPPPNIPELEQAKGVHEGKTLRELLEIHRESPACSGCHQEMDGLGFALENFDAIGRWRDHYASLGKPIDVSGTMKSGEAFEGVNELKTVLVEKKYQFAKSISKRMLGFALGRSIEFKDSRTVDHLAKTLMDNDFDPLPFVQELVYSYPFRYKKSDPVIVDTEFGS